MAGEGADEIRANYRHFLAIPTRWADNDVYGHVNNVVYYEYFDTLVNRFYIDEGGLDIHAAPAIGLVVETLCRYHQPLAYPDTIDAGMRIARLGTSSVRYEIGLFRQGDEAAAATGHFIHVFVDRASRKPTPIPPRIRAALERLAADKKEPSPACSRRGFATPAATAGEGRVRVRDHKPEPLVFSAPSPHPDPLPHAGEGE